MISLFAGSGVVANGFKRAVTHLVSPIRAAPSVSHPQAWSYKNTSMVAYAVMLAAQSHGIGSCPMEGFDARRVRHVVGLPSRYDVPLVVSMGYPSEKNVQLPFSRFEFDELFFEGSFGRVFGAGKEATMDRKIDQTERDSSIPRSGGDS